MSVKVAACGAGTAAPLTWLPGSLVYFRFRLRRQRVARTTLGMDMNECRDRLWRTRPKSLSASAWVLARPVVVAIVLAWAPKSLGSARVAASMLCTFLAASPSWDRASRPDLRVLLTRETVIAYDTRRAAASGSKASTRAAVRRTLTQLATVAAGEPLQEPAPPRRGCATASLFWCAVRHLGPFTAAAQAYTATGAAVRPSMWTRLDGLGMPLHLDPPIGPEGSAAGLVPAGSSDVSGTLAAAWDASAMLADPPAVQLGEVTPMARAARAKTSDPSKPMSTAAALRYARSRRDARAAAEAAAAAPRQVAPPPTLPEPVAAAIAAYGPYRIKVQDWARVQVATRALMTAYRPPSPDWVHSQGATLTRFALWVADRPQRPDTQAALDPAELLDPDLVPAYLVGKLAGRPPNSCSTIRSVLRRATEALRGTPGLEPIARQPVQGPYTPMQCAEFERLARLQPTPALRRSLSTMVSLGLGAGLDGHEQAAISRDRVRTVDLGFRTVRVVDVPGARARTVVVRDRWVPLLDEAIALHREAGKAASDPLYGVSANRKNVTWTARAKAVTARGYGVDINVSRLRATWLVALMCAPVPVGALLTAAGLRSARTLTDLLPYCPAPDPEDVARILAAAREVSTDETTTDPCDDGDESNGPGPAQVPS